VSLGVALGTRTDGSGEAVVHCAGADESPSTGSAVAVGPAVLRRERPEVWDAEGDCAGASTADGVVGELAVELAEEPTDAVALDVGAAVEETGPPVGMGAPVVPEGLGLPDLAGPGLPVGEAGVGEICVTAGSGPAAEPSPSGPGPVRIGWRGSRALCRKAGPSASHTAVTSTARSLPKENTTSSRRPAVAEIRACQPSSGRA
jgi:hypothetical protein